MNCDIHIDTVWDMYMNIDKGLPLTLCGIFTLILIIWVIDLDIVWDFHINIDLSHWPWHCVGFSHKYWFESLTLTLYGILASILIWVIDLDIVWDFHMNIDLSHWPWHYMGFSHKYWFEDLPWHCVGFTNKYWFESLTLTLHGLHQ